ncbi:unnamed protein product [Effrenium voratum]|nr:unnamed protein product [Effrenium voratum]
MMFVRGRSPAPQKCEGGMERREREKEKRRGIEGEDNAGVIIDCAYYNNLKAVRAITHSGDETAGKPTGIQELIWANLNKLPAHVSVLVFVVAAYSGGLLQDVQDGRLHVFEEREVNEIGVYEMERSAAGVDVVAAMVRTDVGWKMRIIEEPAEQGQHFMDILPLLSRVIGTFLPNAPKRQKARSRRYSSWPKGEPSLAPLQ